MPKVSTFCPRCGETIETDVPDAARVEGRAEVDCPACKFSFMIAPARARTTSQGRAEAPPEIERPKGPPAGDLDEGDMRPPYGAAPTAAGPPGGRSGFGGGGGGVRSMKPVAVAVILVIVAILNGSLTLLFLMESDVETFITQTDTRTDFEGVVSNKSGGPLQGVAVTIVRAPTEAPEGNVTVTDQEGEYRFSGLPPGAYTLRFEAEGYKTFIYEVPVFGGENSLAPYAKHGDVQLEEGQGVNRDSYVTFLEHVIIGIRWFSLIGSVIILVGAVAAHKRILFPVVIISAVIGVMMLWFYVTAIFALVALILAIISRKEFQPIKKRG